MTNTTRYFLIAALFGACCLVSGALATDGFLLTLGGACVLVCGLTGAGISALVSGTRHRE